MDLGILLQLAQKNAADINVIVSKIGVQTLIDLAPHFIAIIETLQEQPAQEPIPEK